MHEIEVSIVYCSNHIKLFLKLLLFTWKASDESTCKFFIEDLTYDVL